MGLPPRNRLGQFTKRNPGKAKRAARKTAGAERKRMQQMFGGGTRALRAVLRSGKAGKHERLVLREIARTHRRHR